MTRASVTITSERLAKLREVIERATEQRRGGVSDLARELNVSRATIHRWKNSGSNFRVNRRTLGRLCKVAGTNSRLFTQSRPATPNVRQIKATTRYKAIAPYVHGRNAPRQLDALAMLIYWAVAERYPVVSLMCSLPWSRIGVIHGRKMFICSLFRTCNGLNFAIGVSNNFDIATSEVLPTSSGGISNKNVADVVKEFHNVIQHMDHASHFAKQTQAL